MALAVALAAARVPKLDEVSGAVAEQPVEVQAGELERQAEVPAGVLAEVLERQAEALAEAQVRRLG